MAGINLKVARSHSWARVYNRPEWGIRRCLGGGEGKRYSRKVSEEVQNGVSKEIDANGIRLGEPSGSLRLAV